MNYTKTKKRKNRSFYRNTGEANPIRMGRKGNQKKVSSLDPSKLIRKAEYTEVVPYAASKSFDQFAIHDKLKANLRTKGYLRPTQIQEQTFTHLMEGRDLMGIANTGTGKTAAFLLPIIERLLSISQPFKSLVVVPTRELALQVEQEFKDLTAGFGIYSASFIGGTNVQRDLSRLRKPNHLIIATPGRLLDLANRGALRLSSISVLILDEFDRMLDMGFVKDVKKIVSMMPNRNQTMLFSATMDKSQRTLIDSLLHNPLEIKVSSGNATTNQVEQDIIRVPKEADKFDMLLNLIKDSEFEKVLIFAETKRLVDRVSKRLNRSGVTADHIHGNKTQNYRVKALSKFKRGNVQVLVATDVAARGIDVSGVTHVINYQLPMSFESYIHRIGRTGRAGKKGKAFTFVDEVINNN